MNLTSLRDLKLELKAHFAVPKGFASALGVARATSRFASKLDSSHIRDPSDTQLALGVGQGRKRGDYCLTVRIQRIRGARAIVEQITKRTKGECDIRIVPKIKARQTPIEFFRKRQRPLEAGLSVGVIMRGIRHAGTLGCIVEDSDGYYALSNNHVLAGVNSSEPGDPVVQPGNLDVKASEKTLIGVLDRYVPISFKRSNLVDAAIAELFEDIEFYAGWSEAIGDTFSGIDTATTDDIGRTVYKAGRTTGITEGTITSIEVDRLNINMGTETEPKLAQFSDQIEIIGKNNTTFSTQGDSGSLIIDSRRRVVGLLFAGGPDSNGIDITYANRIDDVLSQLGVSIVM